MLSARSNMKWMRSSVSVRASDDNGNDLRPQDLFSWSSAWPQKYQYFWHALFLDQWRRNKHRQFQSESGRRFRRLVQRAVSSDASIRAKCFVCPGQYSDISATSPEGINLDVIGYDLVGAAHSTPTPTPWPTATPTGPPIVATNPATNVANFSATLNGTVNPNGLSTAVHFEYGTTTNYGSSTATQNYSGSTTQNVFANVGSLSAGATYHFRIVASNAAGTRYGADQDFYHASGPSLS